MILKQFTCADLASVQTTASGYMLASLGIALQDGDVVTFASVEVLEDFPSSVNGLSLMLFKEASFSDASVYGVTLSSNNTMTKVDATSYSGMLDPTGRPGSNRFDNFCQVQDGAGPVELWISPGVMPQATDPGRGQVLMMIESLPVLVAQGGDVWRGATGTTGKF